MFEWEDNFAPHILERGRDYARAGAVKNLVKEDNRITAIVAGSEFYKVDIKHYGDYVSAAKCTCPYADGGNWCKHIAAVLYKSKGAYESGSQPNSSGNKDLVFEGQDELPTVELLKSADRKDLEKILQELALYDDKIESRIRASLAGKVRSERIGAAEMKKDIDHIFSTHTDRSGFINYYNARDFSIDMITYVESTADRLMEEGSYLDAFYMSIYAFVQVGNCGIDDDGEVSDISSSCYFVWKTIVSRCNDEERQEIKNWFTIHAHDGTVTDYMEDVAKEFLKYELASREELEVHIKEMDRLIEESNNSTKCKGIYSTYYGYGLEAIEMRIILMEKLGASEEEIDQFRKEHWNFQSVREYFLRKAREEGDLEEEIHILEESKSLDHNSNGLVHSYSERLVNLYHIRGDYLKEKTERKEDYMAYQFSSLESFKKYREMCTEEEWFQERRELIDSRTSLDIRCELLAEEKLFTELYELILQEDNKIGYINKYGMLLADQHAEQILNIYREYVDNYAQSARNRHNYGVLSSYLRRMRQYPSGDKLVRSLCRNWINRYPTRKVMVEELRKELCKGTL